MHIDVGNHIHIRLVSHISIGAGIAVQSITTLYGVKRENAITQCIKHVWPSPSKS